MSTPNPRARKITTGVIVVHGRPNSSENPRPIPLASRTQTRASMAVGQAETEKVPIKIEVAYEFSWRDSVIMIKTSRILTPSFVIVCSVPRCTSSLTPLVVE